MSGCSFSNPGMSWERTSPSRPIAQMRRVVLLPADAEEHATPNALSTKAAPIRRKRWRVICWLNLSDTILTAPEVLMRLPCQKALLLLAVSTIACHDSSRPTQPTVFAQFVLNDINGRALPTYPAPTPGLTPTIVSGSLTLDNSGKAVVSEHRIEWNGVETTNTVTYIYKINGTDIEFELSPPCPINAICVAPPKGTITTTGVSLEIGRFDSQAIVYNY